MAQVWIDIEENDNCGYFPIQTFEARGEECRASAIALDNVVNVSGRCEVVGWNDGSKCEVRVVPIGDSGAGESILVYGGNHGIRLRPLASEASWSLDSDGQTGEPYMLLPTGTRVDFLD